MAAALMKINCRVLKKWESFHVYLLAVLNKKHSTKISSIKSLNTALYNTTITIQGWIKSIRKQKDFTFFHLNDGSIEKIQIVIPSRLVDDKCTFNAAVEVTGTLVESPKFKQPLEVQATCLKVLGSVDLENFPFSPRKIYPPEYVRQFPHLRPKTNINCAILRLTSLISSTLQNTLIQNDFINVFTPIITSNDCEGAGEVFVVRPASNELTESMGNASTPDEAYFSKKVFLTVSGQLHLEALAGGLSKVFTLGPTFRSENSRTRRHLAEFRMLEAEIAFCHDLEPLLITMEELVKKTALAVLEKGSKDLQIVANFYHSSHEDYLRKLLDAPFAIMSYSEAVELLCKNSSEFKTVPKYGRDISSEHELFLVNHVGSPVFLINWPKSIKPFYMCTVDNNPNLVSCVDLLVPHVGELCGGGLREHRYSSLQERLKSLNLESSLDWYLDLRRFGGSPTGGFGMGLERLIAFLLKVPNVRDIVPFPRTPHNCPISFEVAENLSTLRQYKCPAVLRP